LNNKVSLSILIALVITNATWGATSGHSGPLIALSFYAVVAFLCWRWSHFQAGIIAGVAGVGIHAYELISWGLAELRALEVALLFVNLILPIPLIYFSYKAYREIGKMKEDDLKRLHL
jgi:hypothetical protein